MRIKIITPCSRPENLKWMLGNILHLKEKEWYIIHDAKEISNAEIYNFDWIHQVAVKGGVSGNLQRNFALDVIHETGEACFIYVLDDDNILHPDFNTEIEKLQIENPNKKGFIFSQQLKTHVRNNNENNITECNIDQAQFILHSDLYKDVRYNQHYNADGQLIEKIYKTHSDKFLITDKILCYYNFLKWN